MQPRSKQLEFSNKDERRKLLRTILDDWTVDSVDLEPRSNAAERWVKLWRAGASDPTLRGATDSNFHIPLILWQIFSAAAKELAILFGEDNEIQVKPRGEADAARVEKVRRWMNYRVKESLKLFKKYYDFAILKRIFGTVIAFTPWTRRTRPVRKLITRTVTEYEERLDPATGLIGSVPVQKKVVEEEEGEVVDFEGLDFRVENTEDWIVPKSATSLEDSDHFIRRLRLSVDKILDLRDEGKLDASLFEKKNEKGESELVEKLYQHAKTMKTNTVGGQDSGRQVREARDELSGQPTTPLGSENLIVVYNWVGKFRMKDNKGRRKERADDVVAFVIPGIEGDGILAGASRLVDIFPDGRLPFIKSDLIRDPNRFWGIGLPELLEDINREMDALHNITTDGGMMSVGPMGGYKPMSGFTAEKFKYEPFMMLPLNDPKNDLSFFNASFNPGGYVALMPQLLAMAERVTGLTETQLGRQFSGPNAPRTLGQQQLLQAESNQRLFLDLMLERESFRELMARIWEADKRWLEKPIFFRVTEEDPGDVLTDEDMQGDYDFDITPPTAIANRGQMLQDTIQAYSLLVSNPIALQNPALIAESLKKVLKRLGQAELVAFVPDTSKLRPPMSAEDENVLILQGQDVDPHPADNHIRHIEIHKRLIAFGEQAQQAAPGLLPHIGQSDLIERVNSHIAEHQQAMKTQGGSINMMGRGAPTGGGQVFGGASPQFGQGAGPGNGQQPSGQSNPAANPAAANLASILNSRGANTA